MGMGFEGSALDTALHAVTAVVAVALLTLSLQAYRKRSTRKFLFICIAFALFAVREVLIMGDLLFHVLPGIHVVAHILNLGILIAFFYGVVK
jgi:hypothetical protein